MIELIDAASKRAAPTSLSDEGGRITPGKTSAILTILGWMAFATLAFYALGGGWRGGAASGLLLVPALFMAPSLTSWHDVVWNGRGVTGTRSIFGGTLGWSRTTIAWPEIIGLGKTPTGYWFVRAADGRRVHWSYLYLGYPALVTALARRCPGLDLGLIDEGP